MKVLVIGGVAAGTKVAAKLKRENRDAEVIIFNKGKNISYAGCGLPYYVGDVIKEKSELIVNTPEKYEALTGAKVLCEQEVTSIDRENKTISVLDLATNETSEHSYDKLVIATGASPICPPFPNKDLDNIYLMRTPEDAFAVREAVETQDIKKAVVIGGGFIGLEIAENLKAQGVRPMVVDMAEHVLPGFDVEMQDYVERHLADEGIMCLTSTKVESFEGEDGKVSKVITDKRKLKADLVVMSIGIKPNTQFLKDSGIELAGNGAIVVDDHMRTNDADIYAAGDCVMVKSAITGKETYSPMGSSANIEGRILAQNLAGKDLSYRGVCQTAVCKLPNLNTGRTGLSEKQATDNGFDPISVVCVVDDKAHYYPDHGSFIIKMIADKKTHKFLGVQVLGTGAVDKVVDMSVVALTMKATIDDLVDMDLAYAPPFSTAIHPFVNTLNVLFNKLNGELDSFTPVEFMENAHEGYTILDSCLVPTLSSCEYVDLEKVTEKLPNHELDENILLICNKGKRAYLLQNRLKALGYQNVKVLEGGTIFNNVEDLK